MSALAVPVQADDGLAAWIAPARTALVIIDMQVDFAAPEGRLGQWGVDLSTVPPALEKAQALAEAARKAGAPVVFVGLFTRPETDSGAWRERCAVAAVIRTPTPGFVGPTRLGLTGTAPSPCRARRWWRRPAIPAFTTRRWTAF